MKKKVGGKNTSVACIGPAGEQPTKLARQIPSLRLKKALRDLWASGTFHKC